MELINAGAQVSGFRENARSSQKIRLSFLLRFLPIANDKFSAFACVSASVFSSITHLVVIPNCAY